MSQLSLVIRNARIADGSGRPAYDGAVGVCGDRIVAVGKVEARGAEEIDAGGKVLAPGFIDVHTHYDPQLCWDRLATPSPEHGVTSLVMGNCSISLAPVKRTDSARLINIFGSVEDMEGRLLEANVPFTWESFGSYLDYLREGLGPNVGAFVGHAALRLYVMGEAAQERAATDGEIAQMCAILGEALGAGAFGLSFTYGHLDERGRELPCFFADQREMRALLQTMAKAGRGAVECTPRLANTDTTLAQIDMFGALALETGVMCSLSPLMQLPHAPDQWRRLLARFEEWQAKGAPLHAQVQVRPLDMTMQLSQGSVVLSKQPTWRKALDLPIEARIAMLADPAYRPALAAEARVTRAILDHAVIKRVYAKANERYEGRLIKSIAEEQGKTWSDALLDIALEDDLNTEFAIENFIHGDTTVVSELLNHPGLHIGAADAGAHITQFAGAGDTCYLFEKYVRDVKAMSMERAVQRLTSDLAKGWNIKDRGEIAPGKFADLVIFDPDTIARGKEIWVSDVPGGRGRYVRHPQGISAVIVNGAVLVDNGRYRDARPGRII